MHKGVSRTLHIITVNGPETRSSSIKCINLLAMENRAKAKIKICSANIIFSNRMNTKRAHEENEMKAISIRQPRGQLNGKKLFCITRSDKMMHLR